MKYKYLGIILCVSSISYAMQKTGWTKNYHNTSEMQFLFAQSQLPFMKFQGNEEVLDIGCGTGRTTDFFAQQVPNGSVLAVDASEDMITFAQSEYDKKNIRFEVMNATNLQFGNQFDIVYTFFCLQWLEEQEKQKAVDGIARALKKEGRAYIFVPIASKDYAMGITCIHKVLEKKPEWKPFCTVPNNESADIWIKRFAENNLKVISSRIIEKKTTYASKEDWNKYCANLGITTLLEQEKNQFISQINDLLYQEYNLKDNDAYVRVTNILGLEVVKDNS